MVQISANYHKPTLNFSTSHDEDTTSLAKTVFHTEAEPFNQPHANISMRPLSKSKSKYLMPNLTKIHFTNVGPMLANYLMPRSKIDPVINGGPTLANILMPTSTDSPSSNVGPTLANNLIPS